MVTLNIRLLPGEFAVCRLGPHDDVPHWASGALVSIVRTPAELSIVCDAAQVPADVRSAAGWRALELGGPFTFDLVGILASVAAPLAAAGISLFTISTFDTDYVLVQHERLDDALAALRSSGHAVS